MPLETYKGIWENEGGVYSTHRSLLMFFKKILLERLDPYQGVISLGTLEVPFLKIKNSYLLSLDI